MRAAAALLLALALVACQTTTPLDVADGDPDAAADAAPVDSEPDAAPPADATPEGEPDAMPPDCDERVADVGGGKHRPGRPCLNCHGAGGDAPRFSLAGTVFDDIASTTPVVGATIRIVDADGKELRLVTQRNGNFYTREAVAFPLQVAASLCPDLLPMGSRVRQGNCNGCHRAGSRIYIPPL